MRGGDCAHTNSELVREGGGGRAHTNSKLVCIVLSRVTRRITVTRANN